MPRCLRGSGELFIKDSGRALKDTLSGKTRLSAFQGSSRVFKPTIHYPMPHLSSLFHKMFVFWNVIWLVGLQLISLNIIQAFLCCLYEDLPGHTQGPVAPALPCSGRTQILEGCSLSGYILIFCKQVRTTGEIVMIHIAHKAVMV